jgi:hypothetical protein
MQSLLLLSSSASSARAGARALEYRVDRSCRAHLPRQVGLLLLLLLLLLLQCTDQWGAGAGAGARSPPPPPRPPTPTPDRPSVLQCTPPACAPALPPPRARPTARTRTCRSRPCSSSGEPWARRRRYRGERCPRSTPGAHGGRCATRHTGRQAQIRWATRRGPSPNLRGEGESPEKAPASSDS